MIKHFSIFRAKEGGSDKAPTHNISAKIGEEFVNIGGCWTKEGKSGKYLSCKLQDVWVDHTDRSKTRKGFAIADEKQILTDEPTNAPETPKTAPSDDFNEF